MSRSVSRIKTDTLETDAETQKNPISAPKPPPVFDHFSGLSRLKTTSFSNQWSFPSENKNFWDIQDDMNAYIQGTHLMHKRTVKRALVRNFF